MIEEFLKIAVNLKTISRQGWINKTNISSPESVADHVYATSVMAMVFGDLLKLDTEKLIKMSLLHDLAESITGDLTPDKILPNEKTTLENKTMKKILTNLPDSLNENYGNLWNEFIQNKSLESNILHEIDKLEMALQASIYSKNFKDKSFAVFLETAKNTIQNPELKKTFNSFIKNNEKANRDV